MKFLVLLAVVAFCSAYPYQTFGGYGYGSGIGHVYGPEHNFHVNLDGSVTITTGYGKEITISKGMGLNNIVEITYPTVGTTWPFHQKYQPSHVGVLEHIFSQYQGVVSPISYQQLLGDIYSAVQNGQLDYDLYLALYNLHYLHGGMEDVIVPQAYPPIGVHGIFGHRLFGQYGYPVGQHFIGSLPKIVENEKVILDQQNQIQEDQKLQHYQQEQLALQQLYHQKQQEQQQIEHRYVQELQEQVQDEQVQVLKQQKYHQFYPQYSLHEPVHYPLAGGYNFGSYWHHQPSTFLHKGLYGLYGQGNQYWNVPMVY